VSRFAHLHTTDKDTIYHEWVAGVQNPQSAYETAVDIQKTMSLYYQANQKTLSAKFAKHIKMLLQKLATFRKFEEGYLEQAQ